MKDKLNNMTWSFSRIQAYNICPYMFYLQYIKEIPQTNNAFAQFGTLCHDLLNRYFKGELLVFELLDEYVNNFYNVVTEPFPPNQFVDLRERYFQDGYRYFQAFDGLKNYRVIESEREVRFRLGKFNFLGYIDLIVQNQNDEVEIIDHKSRKLEKVSKDLWQNINKRRQTEVYQYFRQLYVYAIPLIEAHGLQPKYLNLNCIRTQEWIRIPFDEGDYEESKQWVLNTIEKIYADETMTDKHQNDFYCNHICSCRHYCEYSNCYLGGI